MGKDTSAAHVSDPPLTVGISLHPCHAMLVSVPARPPSLAALPLPALASAKPPPPSTPRLPLRHTQSPASRLSFLLQLFFLTTLSPPSLSRPYSIHAIHAVTVLPPRTSRRRSFFSLIDVPTAALCTLHPCLVVTRIHPSTAVHQSQHHNSKPSSPSTL